MPKIQKHYFLALFLWLTNYNSLYADDLPGATWRPLFSLFLPGYGQFADGDKASGWTYAGVAGLGLVWQINNAEAVEHIQESPQYKNASEDERKNIENHHPIFQERTISGQVQLVTGGLSAYQSFRSIAQRRQFIGEYSFLNPQYYETPTDILAAPFNVKMLTRPTTAIPLLLIAGLTVLNNSNRSEDFRSDPLDSQDLVFTSAISYNAGTSEEAIFRGWILPYTYEKTNSHFYSNLIQSTLFALAHRNQVSIPIIQFGLGYYFGWLTMKNNWQVAESIFIHSWWDVFALSIQYSNKHTTRIFLPPLKMKF